MAVNKKIEEGLDHIKTAEKRYVFYDIMLRSYIDVLVVIF
jgi:hypothetical protein